MKEHAVFLPEGVRLEARPVPGTESILTSAALSFLSRLHRQFEARRRELLEQRQEVQRRLDRGAVLDFLPATRSIREGIWQVDPIPADLQDRKTEITGPPERKMAIHALNSGARVFMADFEDAQSPTWANNLQGQVNVRDAVRRELRWVGEDGRELCLVDSPATLLVRPRGLHLVEKHLLID